MLELLNEGAITIDDLEDFSLDLKETIKHFLIDKIGRYVNMRDSIENISQLQKQLNDLQLENQILKTILEKAGLSYHKELSAFRQSDSKEAFDPEQGKRIIHPQAITENMANQFFGVFWGRQDVFAKRSVNKETGSQMWNIQEIKLFSISRLKI